VVGRVVVDVLDVVGGRVVDVLDDVDVVVGRVVDVDVVDVVLVDPSVVELHADVAAFTIELRVDSLPALSIADT